MAYARKNLRSEMSSPSNLTPEKVEVWHWAHYVRTDLSPENVDAALILVSEISLVCGSQISLQ